MAKWFEADKEGLGKLLRRRGIAFGVIELIQNAFDEDSTEVRVNLTKIPGRRQRYQLMVTDDNPEGFKDLSHAYTLFAESTKKDDPLKRGRFNLGEKLVLALCEEASISTTKGTVYFEANGERRQARQKLESGSTFLGEIIMSEDEYQDVVKKIETIITPPEISLYFNGGYVSRRHPVRSFDVDLPTVRSDADGNLTPTRRITEVEIFEPLSQNEPAMIYEMGLPIVGTGDRFDVNIGQKVPLNMSRDNVTPAYLREVRTAVLNHTYDLIEDEEANGTWVKTALEDKRVRPEAVQGVLTKLYGEERVVYDPTDTEANARAIDLGASLIHGRSFSKAAWSNIREKDRQGTPPAGVAYPTPKPFHPDGAPLKILEEEDWTPEIRNVVAYAKWLATELMGRKISVVIADDPNWKFGGAYGDGRLTINRRRHGPFKVNEGVNAFLIHEFGHQFESSHLSDNYHRALCKLGARFGRLALEKPEMMKEFWR